LSGRRWVLGLGLAFGGVLLSASTVRAGILGASWTAPTTNVDGSALATTFVYFAWAAIAPNSYARLSVETGPAGEDAARGRKI